MNLAPYAQGTQTGNDVDSLDSCRMEAMLQILWILSSFGKSLECALDNSMLSHIPPQLRQTLIPQLMALLRHPQENTRECMKSILMTLARDFPLSLVYPVVVEYRGNVICLFNLFKTETC